MPAVFVSNGWTLLAYPDFGDPLQELQALVEALRQKHPEAYMHHPKARLLARLDALLFTEIPRDPNAAVFQLGNTMGADYRHWRRAKFLGRLRLFFRFSSSQKVIVYAWVNDQSTMTKAGARSDPYAVFAKRLQAGDPPDDWDELVRSSAPLATPPRKAGSPPAPSRSSKSRRT
jgi:toxin YhaV